MMKRTNAQTNLPSHWAALLVLLSSSAIAACGSEAGTGSDQGQTSPTGGAPGEPNGTGGETSSGGSKPGPTAARELDGKACEAGQDVFDECSSCLCGESGTYSCIFVPGCEEPAPNPNPEPGGPDEFEGQPCDGTDLPSFPCASCFCTDAGTYSCAVIDHCDEPLDGCGNQPAPLSPCDEGWICNESVWMCNDDPDCPRVAPPTDLICSTEVVQFENPLNGTCCTYSNPCETPRHWEPCGSSVGSKL